MLNGVGFLAGHGTESNAGHLPGGDSSHLHLQGGSAGEHVGGKVKPGLPIREKRLQGVAANRGM